MSGTINPHTGQPYSTNAESLQSAAASLPVTLALPDLRKTIRDNKVTIVVGETGSGKTTQLPKALMEEFSEGKIVLTQTRRLAADLVAKQIATEMDVELGGDVIGLLCRGVQQLTKTTRLVVTTDGTLLASARNDKNLRDFTIFIIDEAHQHTIATDILLGRLRELATIREDLRIVITSATMDTTLFADYFEGAVVKTVKGREFGVEISYLPTASQDVMDTLVETVLRVHLMERSGDILVFVLGAVEAEKLIQRLQAALSGNKAIFDAEVGPLMCHSLYSQLPTNERDEAVNAVAPPGHKGKIGRKLIAATTALETSITLVGVTHVIDTLQVKVKVWDPRTEIYTLHTCRVSKGHGA